MQNKDSMKDINIETGGWDVIPREYDISTPPPSPSSDECVEKRYVDVIDDLKQENERLKNLVSFITNECRVLNSENDDLQDRLNEAESNLLVNGVLSSSGAFDDSSDEIERKEMVIKKKDEKASRLINIIRGKNEEIDRLVECNKTLTTNSFAVVFLLVGSVLGPNM